MWRSLYDWFLCHEAFSCVLRVLDIMIFFFSFLFFFGLSFAKLTGG